MAVILTVAAEVTLSLFHVGHGSIARLTILSKRKDSAVIVERLGTWQTNQRTRCESSKDKSSKRLVEVTLKRGTGQSSDMCDDVKNMFFLLCYRLFPGKLSLKSVSLNSGLISLRWCESSSCWMGPLTRKSV